MVGRGIKGEKGLPRGPIGVSQVSDGWKQEEKPSENLRKTSGKWLKKRIDVFVVPYLHSHISGWWWLEHDFFVPFSWECHDPNWRTHIFERGRYTTKQIRKMTEDYGSPSNCGGCWDNAFGLSRSIGMLLCWVDVSWPTKTINHDEALASWLVLSNGHVQPWKLDDPGSYPGFQLPMVHHFWGGWNFWNHQNFFCGGFLWSVVDLSGLPEDQFDRRRLTFCKAKMIGKP